MLVQFTVENYLSFKGEAVLNMTATADTLHKNHVEHDEQGKKISTLHAAALYGANASGKSNLIKAIAFARGLIVNGTRPDMLIPVVPFKLDHECALKPSKFEFTIKHEGVLYTYGFAANSKTIVEEWLFVNHGKRETSCFERTTGEDGKLKVKIGASLAAKGSEQETFLGFVAKGTWPNQLFLTEAHRKNVDKIKPLMHWFIDSLVILKYDLTEYNQMPQDLAAPSPYSETALAKRIDEEQWLRVFLHSSLKTAIKEIKFLNIRKNKRLFATNFFADYANKKRLEDNIETSEKTVVRELFTVHAGLKNKEIFIPFELDEESDGTRRLIQTLPVLYDALTKGKTFFIDEIERSLHPLLSRLLLQTFLESEPCRGQIIFTTHETSLMDLDLLRRDEIWFAEKDEEESSRIYSLAEFRVRNDLKIDKGYLQGRFGGIPFFGDAARLGAVEK